MDQLQDIVTKAEEIKKRADVHFARSEFVDAVQSYDTAIKKLATLRGLPIGEVVVVRCLANQAQCYLKQEDYAKALQAVNVALTVPAAVTEPHLLSKLWLRKYQALEALGDEKEAVLALDNVLALGLPPLEELEKARARLITSISSKNGIVALPPKPIPLTPQMIEGALIHILQNKGDPAVIMGPLTGTVSKRGWLDTHDSKNNNLVWAVCQAALMRAEASKDSDKVFPILELLYQNGARAEQRYPHQGNRTPLQMLAMAGACRCAAMSMSYGASVFTCDDNGWTPLVVACSPNGPMSGKNTAMIDLLIRAGSQVNHQTFVGLCPLAAAAQCGDAEGTKKLLTAGGNVNMRCAMGFSCLIWAKIGSNGADTDTIKVIVDAVNATNNPALVFEVDQDIRCYNVAKVLTACRRINFNYKSMLSSASVQRRDEELVKFLRAVFNCSVESGVEEKEPNVLETLHTALNSVTPYIFLKKWVGGPKGNTSAAGDSTTSLASSELVSSQEGAAAEAALLEPLLAAATPLDKCWLNIVTTAVSGPAPDGAPMSLVTRPGLPFHYLRLCEDMMRFVQYPLSRSFSPSIPNQDSLTALLGLGPIIQLRRKVVDSDSSFYTNDYWTKQMRLRDANADIETLDVSDSQSHSSASVQDLRHCSSRALVIIGSALFPTCCHSDELAVIGDNSGEAAIEAADPDVVSAAGQTTDSAVMPPNCAELVRTAEELSRNILASYEGAVIAFVGQATIHSPTVASPPPPLPTPSDMSESGTDVALAPSDTSSSSTPVVEKEKEKELPLLAVLDDLSSQCSDVFTRVCTAHGFVLERQIGLPNWVWNNERLFIFRRNSTQVPSAL